MFTTFLNVRGGVVSVLFFIFWKNTRTLSAVFVLDFKKFIFETFEALFCLEI